MEERISGTIREESNLTRGLGTETTEVETEEIAGTMDDQTTEAISFLEMIAQGAETVFFHAMVVQRAETALLHAKVGQRAETECLAGMRDLRVEEVVTEVVEVKARVIEVRETEIEAKVALQVKRAGTTIRQGTSSSRWIRNKGGIKPT